MSQSDTVVLCILAAGILFSVGKKKLTAPAALSGAVIGWIIYASSGFTGLAMMTAFFILATAATSHKKALKLHIDDNAAHQQTRTTGQVLANAGVAAIAGLLILLDARQKPLLLVAMAASLASATADTLASELGLVYGRRFVNILTGRPDNKGLDGVISLEGVLFGTIAAAAIAGIYSLGYGWQTIPFILITVSGTTGNLIDSILGASLERKGMISNNLVNFLNTLAAALLATLLYHPATRAFG
jgi:uncharacterized protein (TIGR00297 family)